MFAVLASAHDFTCPPLNEIHSAYIKIAPVHHGGWPASLRTTFCSLQESQQEAFANAGQFDDSAPSTVNRWYPDLGQNMSGT